MEKQGKIKGLTMLYESNEKLLHRGLLLRWANGDLEFDIENKINFELKCLKENPDRRGNYTNSFADFTYWKYKFLSDPRNKYCNIDKALLYLHDAYEHGSPDAIAQYAYYYYVGKVLTDVPDKKKAMKLFEQAFECVKNRKKIGQETPFVEFLFAEALSSDCNYDVEALNKVVHNYEIALKERKVYQADLKLRGYKLQLSAAESMAKNNDKYSGGGMFESLKDMLRSSNNKKR